LQPCLQAKWWLCFILYFRGFVWPYITIMASNKKKWDTLYFKIGIQTWQFLYFLLISITNLKTGRFETRRFETWRFVNLTFWNRTFWNQTFWNLKFWNLTFCGCTKLSALSKKYWIIFYDPVSLMASRNQEIVSATGPCFSLPIGY
jgi:hypothetical protein